MTTNSKNSPFGCDKAQIIAFLNKVKKYFNEFIQCTYLDENCKPLEDCQCPDDAFFVELCIGDKDPIKICLNPIKGVKIGQDENGNDILADVENSIADLSKCCPVEPIEIPATAFEDPENPTQGEVNTWITSNYPDAPSNTLFYTGYKYSGNPDDPDWVWSYDGNGNTINIESPVDACQMVQECLCVEDKAGNRINATLEEGKIVINLPPVLVCQITEPATDGSEGCVWYDDSCLHILCNGVWVSPDASVTTS